MVMKKKPTAVVLVALQLVLDFKDFEAAKKTDEEVKDNTAAANNPADAAATMEAALPVVGETALAAKGEDALVEGEDASNKNAVALHKDEH